MVLLPHSFLEEFVMGLVKILRKIPAQRFGRT